LNTSFVSPHRGDLSETPPPEAATSERFNWRSHLKLHPAADMFPLLSPDELQALAEDIRQNGLSTPIVLTWGDPMDDPLLLDGRNRLDALALLGWLGPRRERRPREPAYRYQRSVLRNPLSVGDLDDETCFVPDECFKIADGDPYDLALSLNVHRRHLRAEQKRELIAKMLKAKPESSDRSIAEPLRVDHKTVGTVRHDLEDRGEIPHHDKRTDTKGRKQPALRRNISPVERKIGTDGQLRKAKPATKVPQAWREKAAAHGRDIAVGPYGALYMVPKDTVLESFDAGVLELAQLTKGQKPQRFTKTVVPMSLLDDLAHYLRELLAVRKLTADDDDATTLRSSDALEIANRDRDEA
jgi:hypothetical protein